MRLFKVGDKAYEVRTMRSRFLALLVIAALSVLSSRVLNAEGEEGAPAASGEATVQKNPASAPGEGGDYVIEKRGDKTIKYKKKTSYDFEGSSIDGLYNKPSGSYISNIKDVKGKSIIRIRENFDAEVVDSARSLK